MTRMMSGLARGSGFVVSDLRILERTRAWSKPETTQGHQIVFVRRGLFGVRLPGWHGVVDPLIAYLRRPDDEQRIAHRPGHEDACTVLTLDDALAAEVLPARPLTRMVRTSGAVDLAHRRVLARARAGLDTFALSEAVVRLAADVFGPADEVAARSSRPSQRRLADAARELLVGDPARARFEELARELGVSRPHLSRVFRAETGESLTRFRTRLRVRAALDQLEAGRTNLAELAADLGFADHAHLTRTMRAELDLPPTAVRTLLGAG